MPIPIDGLPLGGRSMFFSFLYPSGANILEPRIVAPEGRFTGLAHATLLAVENRYLQKRRNFTKNGQQEFADEHTLRGRCPCSQSVR